MTVTPDPTPVTVATLVCHRDLELALLALPTLARFSAQPVRFRVHDDGSLTGEDRARLGDALNEARVVSRAEADEVVQQMLRAYPQSARYRRQKPHALKLFDVVAMESGDTVAFVDPDVAFVRPFSGLFVFPAGVHMLLMRDVTNAYGLRSWHLLRHPSWRIGRRINTGLFIVRKAHFDLDFVESYFHTAPPNLRPGWQEQTCWSLLAMRMGCRLWDGKQVRLMGKWHEVTEELVAGHFCLVPKGEKASYLREVLSRLPAGGEAVTVGVEPHQPVELTRWNLWCEEVYRVSSRLGRFFGLDMPTDEQLLHRQVDPKGSP